MGQKFILSIDLGTTGNRVFCFNEHCEPISFAYKELTQIYPQPGWVEHNPVEIWDAICALIPEAIQKGDLDSRDTLSIGITNQRETALLWDKQTGIPVYNAIVWQCRRTKDICKDLKAAGHEPLIRKKTGLVVDAYFSGTKVKWLFDNIKEVREVYEQDNLLFGTIDTWILWKLTQGKSHKTDYTNASRTLLFDIQKKEWSHEILKILQIPSAILPSVQDSASVFGKTINVPGIPDGVPIGGIAGDQQAAMVGQNCITAGTIKNTYGTGCFMLLHNGNSFTLSHNGLLTTLSCDHKGTPNYAIEGSVFVGGAVIQWMRDYMHFFTDCSQTEAMAFSLDNDDNVVFIPAFVGLGAPYWEMDARGAIMGLTRDTSIEQIVRAALKSIALQSFDLITAMQDDTGKKIHNLRVDGGAVKNTFLMQYQSDILNIPIHIPKVIESTALGAAMLAGLSTNIYNSLDEIKKYNTITKEYMPIMSEENRQKEIDRWTKSISKLIGPQNIFFNKKK